MCRAQDSGVLPEQAIAAIADWQQARGPAPASSVPSGSLDFGFLEPDDRNQTMIEETFPMPLPADVEELHLLAEYHTACRSLRRMGWGGIVFGIINIALGIGFAFALNPINALLTLIGLLLLASGVWCLVLPTAEAVIANGIALVLVGLWNIFVTLLNTVAGQVPQVWWALFGVALIVAGVKSFQKYARFSRALRHGATKDEMATMDRLVKTILKANAKTDEDIVTFSASTFMQKKMWRGQLRDNVAVFVDKMSKEILVADKADVRIEPHGKVLIGKTLKASVKILDQKWEALIAPTEFERYRDWKFREDENYGDDKGDEYEREPETGIRARDDRVEKPPAGFKED
jgi:hypothetical protein